MPEAIEHERLIDDLAAARDHMAAYGSALRRDLDFGAKLKRGVRNYPVAWFAGAVVVGLLLSRIPARRKKVEVKGPLFGSKVPEGAGKAAVALTLLKLALDFARPAMLQWFKARYFGKPGNTARRF